MFDTDFYKKKAMQSLKLNAYRFSVVFSSINFWIDFPMNNTMS